MRLFLFTLIFTLLIAFTERVHAQGFPNPVLLSTGQGTQGTLDPIWTVSGWYASNPPNPMSATYTPALISNNCAPGAWVNPGSLPPPVNNGNWITNPSYPCSSNRSAGYIYFRLTFTLPQACDGRSITSIGSYSLSLSGYVDNSISNVYVNGTSTGFSGGGYSPGSQLNFTLTGPWVSGTNYVDIQVFNTPNGGSQNPYGLLLVADAAAVDTADSDHDGVPDVSDSCPCVFGSRSNGCPYPISGDTIICIGNPTVLTATEAGDAFRWSTGSTADSIVVNPTSTTRYTLYVSNSNGFLDTGAVYVVVNPLPIVTVSPLDTSVCPGDSATLTASGGVSYVWSTAAATPAITVSPAAVGSTRYTVTATDANSCRDTASGIITIYAPPIPVINPLTPQVCLNQSTVLTASGGVSYLWSNSANTAATTVSPLINSPYSVTVTDIHSCTASTTVTVTVNPLPNPGITLTRAQICFGNSDTLIANGGLSYLWSTTANIDSIVVSPRNTTSYSVTATDINHCTASATNTVIVNPLPIPVINPAVAQVCIGSSTQLTASGGVGYVWNNSATTAAITVSTIADATYSVTVTDANSCSATASKLVTVNPLPTPSVNPDTVQICIGASTTLTASGGVRYIWSNNANTASITVSPTSSTTYSVTVTDANTCSATTSGTVEVNPLPTPVIDPPTAQICLGYSQTLTASGGVSYAWNTSARTAAVTVSPTATSTYSVMVTDTNGCSNSTSRIVTVIPYMILTIDSTNVTCNGAANGTMTLSVSSGLSPYNYLWNNYSTSADITGLTPGQYSVTVTDNAGCTATASASISQPLPLVLTSTYANPACETFINGRISINVAGGTQPYQYNWSNSAQGPTLTDLGPGNYSVLVTDANSCTVGSPFSLRYVYDFSVRATTPSDSVDLGDTTTISYHVSGHYGSGFTGLWSPDYALSCTTCVTAIAAPNVSTLYQITLANDTGCITSDSLMIYVIPDYSIYVPNAFTPNGDGTNDYFRIYGKLTSLAYLEIQIFDRWGELVFRSNDLGFIWDGTFKGIMEAPGLFLWQLNLSFINGHSEFKKGSLSLIR